MTGPALVDAIVASEKALSFLAAKQTAAADRVRETLHRR